jgi:hypothetical protein
LNSFIHRREEPTECDSGSIQTLNLEFSKIKDKILSSTSQFQLSNLVKKADILTLHETWRGCNNKLESIAKRENVTVPRNTTDCGEKHGTPQFAADPCCNKT